MSEEHFNSNSTIFRHLLRPTQISPKPEDVLIGIWKSDSLHEDVFLRSKPITEYLQGSNWNQFLIA